MNWANGAQTTLASAITAGAIQLTVASAALFPAVPFHIVIDSELMTVTAVSGTTWTITRGIESTTAAAHASGSLVTCVVTAGDLAGFASGGAAVGAAMHLSASVAYGPAGNYQLCPLDTVDFDTTGTICNTMSSTMTIPSTGYYLLTNSVAFSGSANGVIGVTNNSGAEGEVTLNSAPGGATVPGSQSKPVALSGTNVTTSAAVVAHFTAGDVLRLQGYMGNNTGFFLVSASSGCSMSIWKLG